MYYLRMSDIDIINLKKKNSGGRDNWTMEDILRGVQYFYTQYNRYPTAHDFDKFEYLPTARTIQRSFGGLVTIREKLNLGQIHNYTTGSYRSEKAKAAYRNAQQYEEEFYLYLISKVPEVQVHEHKIIRPGNICSDFYIYKNTQDKKGIVIDLFYAQDILSLTAIVRIKLKRYSGLPHRIFFVLVGNNDIKQEEINLFLNNKKTIFPDNIKVVQEKIFKNIFLKELDIS